MVENLKVILYPDPRLKKTCADVQQIDETIRQLAARMLELMREHRGVGLAAPQVGVNLRLFVMNATGKEGDDRVYINPTLIDAEGADEDEEGCLSIPKLIANIARSAKLRLQATDLDGQPVDLTETGYVARIWQHEFDHLNGILITDRMGPVAKLTNRRLLRDLQDKYEADHPRPTQRSSSPRPKAIKN